MAVQTGDGSLPRAVSGYIVEEVVDLVSGADSTTDLLLRQKL